MTLTYFDRKYIEDVVLSIIVIFGSLGLSVLVHPAFMFGLGFLVFTAFRKEKPRKNPIFAKCKHLQRSKLTRICSRCGIKVVWEGDEDRYDD